MNVPMDERLKFPIVQTIPFVVCPSCGNGAGAGLTIIDDFFMGNPLICEACRGSTDAWTAFLATINHPVPFLHDAAAMFVGCKTSCFCVDLVPGGTVKISFAAQGVPAGSRILRLNYTAGLGIHPVELHGNEVQFRRGRDTVYLYGKPIEMPVGESPDTVSELPVKVSVYATFSEPTIEEHSKSALAGAFAALNAAEYLEMVVPATVAIEFTCKQLINDIKTCLPLNDEGFRDKHLLPQVVPEISAALGIPPLKQEIVKKVSRLWGQRDRAAHTGRLYQPYDRQNAAIQLAAAVFAFRYLQLLRRNAEAKGLLKPQQN